MAAEKTIGIVLKVVEFSESSCVVTMYTRDFGKVTALAKGARRLKSPFEGAIDLLTSCRIVFLRKSVDKLDVMTEAKLVRRFRSASSDLNRFYAALYVIELVNVLTDHAEPQPDLYEKLCQAIEHLDDPERAVELPSIVMRFEFDLLRLLGHHPSLDECVSCGRPVSASGRERIAFGLIAGGVYCSTCRVGKRSVAGIAPDTMEIMKRLSKEEVDWNLTESQPDHPNQISSSSVGELRGVMDQYLSNLAGFRPKMQTWLSQVFNQQT